MRKNKSIVVVRLSNKQKQSQDYKKSKGFIRLIAALGASVTLMSCGGFHASVCTTAGCRAHNDLITGTISETKTSPDTEGAHYKLRQAQETRPNLVEGLRGMFGGGAK